MSHSLLNSNCKKIIVSEFNYYLLKVVLKLQNGSYFMIYLAVIPNNYVNKPAANL